LTLRLKWKPLYNKTSYDKGHAMITKSSKGRGSPLMMSH
jgi:hypothetical protein